MIIPFMHIPTLPFRPFMHIPALPFRSLPSARLRAAALASVNRMATALVAREVTGSEADAIRCLLGRGFGCDEIALHAGDALAEARRRLASRKALP